MGRVFFGSPPDRGVIEEQAGTGTRPLEAPGRAGSMSPCIVTSRMTAPCDNCGLPASPVHMPRQEHGLYCEECCPVCSQRSKRRAASTKE